MIFEDIRLKGEYRLSAIQSQLRFLGKTLNIPFSGKDTAMLVYEISVHRLPFTAEYLSLVEKEVKKKGKNIEGIDSVIKALCYIPEQLRIVNKLGLSYQQIVILRSCFIGYEEMIDRLLVYKVKSKADGDKFIEEIKLELGIPFIQIDKVRGINYNSSTRI